MNLTKKEIHRQNMVRIAAAAIQHAMKSASLDAETSKLIEHRIEHALSGDISSEIQKINTEVPLGFRTDNSEIPKIRLLYASKELVRMANFGGYVSGHKVRHILFVCWDAIYTDEEQSWQDKNLEPLIEKCFRNQGIPLASGEILAAQSQHKI